MRAFLVNFKRTRKPCYGASSHSWHRSLLQAPRATRTNRGIFADAKWRGRLESAVGEACAVAAGDGATLDREKILATLESLPATMRSSMQKDVSAGRMPELDAIGGPIIRAGRRYGLNSPTTRELVATIQDRLKRALHQDTNKIPERIVS